MSDDIKMNGKSLDINEQRRRELKQLFPGVFTETMGDDGQPMESIDFERLKAELGTFSDIYEGRRERYGMEWPGKRDCMKLIQEPSRATLKPCREESVDFDTTQNLFIEGDNLEVLKLLQKSYYGKVKMIYIDPPYNTGNEFIYPDNYAESLETYLAYAGLVDDEGKKFSTNTASEGRFHTKWLNMMYPRLYLARNLLADDGVFCASISDHEHKNFKEILDGVFGEENFINSVSVLAKVSAGASGGGEDKKLKKNIEYILIYAKNYGQLNNLTHMFAERPLVDVVNEMRDAGESWKYTSILLDCDERKMIGTVEDGDGNPIKIYKRNNVQRTTINRIMSEEGISEEVAYGRYFEKIFSDTNAQTSIRQRVIDFVGNLEDGELLEVEYVPRSGKDKDKLVTHSYISNTVRKVIWLSDVAEQTAHGVVKKEKVGTFWDWFDYNNVGREGGVPFPNGKKPIGLLMECLKLINDDDFIALDYFSGSSTLGHAVVEMNKTDGGSRRFVLAQLPEPLNEKDKNHASAVQFCKDESIAPTLSALGKLRLKKWLFVKLCEIPVKYPALAIDWSGFFHGHRRALQPATGCQFPV
ncbi:MAG: site-specific DNA-methyltransferase, partial [Gammaproteobacteria bacterium]|nr:site-specific DNA-methyltransferase [Gammaproteobacteria bacterium]